MGSPVHLGKGPRSGQRVQEKAPPSCSSLPSPAQASARLERPPQALPRLQVGQGWAKVSGRPPGSLRALSLEGGARSPVGVPGPISGVERTASTWPPNGQPHCNLGVEALHPPPKESALTWPCPHPRPAPTPPPPLRPEKAPPHPRAPARPPGQEGNPRRTPGPRIGFPTAPRARDAARLTLTWEGREPQESLGGSAEKSRKGGGRGGGAQVTPKRRRDAGRSAPHDPASKMATGRACPCSCHVARLAPPRHNAPPLSGVLPRPGT
ncbi:basic proline-rich protein-like [Sorex araneus]|uniref:basic proline-rich protein-like n=1 Tax=Sorex araneus TaxID=42254 RepID=UPI0024336B76|nr:basic proline-rich protein-like [Sorex araneus]